MQQSYSLWVLFVILTLSSITDLSENKIPNILIATGMMLALPCIGYIFAIRCIITLAILYPLYKIRIFGAGDIKLAMFMVGLLGYHIGFKQIFIGLLIASVISVALMAQRGIFIQRMKAVASYISSTSRLLSLGKKPMSYIQSNDRDFTMPIAPCMLAGCIAQMIAIGHM